MTHHERRDGGIETRILGSGTLTLEPPGLALEVATLFEDWAEPSGRIMVAARRWSVEG
ncbi:hypothetical protein [Benzoatithermus flavus]|uniref:Uncharacterized protein n=1 Tax=Benzoatithermus flavus TaxID=3108223 RepID=A0ABU8XRY4_9PROT